jgi:hypothetical protein
MAIKSKTRNVNLQIISVNADVLLTITIGNAQIGGSLIQWTGSDAVVAKGAITNLNLGNGSTIKGKVLKIVTNVLDVNGQTNGIVVTNFFHNCTPQIDTFDDKVDNDGDIYQIITNYSFS